MCMYYKLTAEFCDWLKHEKEITIENSSSIITKIMEIYIASCELTYPENDIEEKPLYQRTTLSLSTKQHDAYWEIFDPYICDEPVCASLFDDVNDIYNDIQEGVSLYEQGFKDDAFWHWKWSFENHWKYHAVDAIRALNGIK